MSSLRSSFKVGVRNNWKKRSWEGGKRFAERQARENKAWQAKNGKPVFESFS